MKGAQAQASPASSARPAPWAVTPVWQRLPGLAAFAWQPVPLLYNVAASALACAAADFVFDRKLPAAVVTLGELALVLAAASLVVAHFALRAIEHTSAGYLDSRAYPPGSLRFDLARPARMLVLTFVAPLLAGCVASLLPTWAALLVLLAGSLLLPAALMTLARTDSFHEVFEPRRLWSTATRTGAGYALLCAFFVLMYGGFYEVLAGAAHRATQVVLAPPPEDGVRRGAQAAAILHETLSLGGFSVFFFVLSFAANYFQILASVLVGYTMYQYSDALGVQVIGPGEARARRAMGSEAHARRHREAMIAKLVAGGEMAEAISLINDELAQRPNDVSLHSRLHVLLLQEGLKTKIESHAARYFDLLMDASNIREAMALWEQTRAMIPDFTPRDPAHLTVLARDALAEGRLQLAADLVRGFDRRFPAHPAIPDAYLIGARALLQGGRPDQAQRLLQLVVDLYPASQASAEAKRYLERFVR
jgi:tetratricopeptide (TPR) repeat protein